MSSDIDVVISRSTVFENVGVGVEIMSVCRWKLKLHQPAENLRFFHGGCPWFSSSFQVPERATVTRKTPEHPELDALGTGFDHIFKFTRIAKILQKHREWGANLPPPPPAVRELTVTAAIFDFRQKEASAFLTIAQLKSPYPRIGVDVDPGFVSLAGRTAKLGEWEYKNLHPLPPLLTLQDRSRYKIRGLRP